MDIYQFRTYLEKYYKIDTLTEANDILNTANEILNCAVYDAQKLLRINKELQAKIDELETKLSQLQTDYDLQFYEKAIGEVNQKNIKTIELLQTKIEKYENALKMIKGKRLIYRLLNSRDYEKQKEYKVNGFDDIICIAQKALEE